MCTQGADWEQGPHILRAKDASIGWAHVVTQGATLHQGLQHTLTQTGCSTALFRSIAVCRWANVMYRFRLQWCREAGANMSCPRPCAKCSLDVIHCERQRDPRSSDRGVTSPSWGHSNSSANTSRFWDYGGPR